MAKCYSGNTIAKGLKVFQDNYQQTGDFIESSNVAVEHLNKQGVDISYDEFFRYAEQHFRAVIGKSKNFFNAHEENITKVMNAITRHLGVQQKYSPAKGSLNRIAKMAFFSGQAELETGDITTEKIIAKKIKEGYENRDLYVLKEALHDIEKLREENKGEIEAIEKKKNDEIVDLVNKTVEAVSLLTKEKQAARKITELYKNEEATLQEVKDAVSTIGKDYGQRTNESEEEYVNRVIDQLDSEATKTQFVKSRAKSDIVWENYDVHSVIDEIDRRGSTSSKGGFLDGFIYDGARKAKQDMKRKSNKNMLAIANTIAQAYDVDISVDQTSAKRRINQLDVASQAISKLSVDFAQEFRIDIKGGRVTLTKGELIQLYMHSLDPFKAKNLALAGITSEVAEKIFESGEYLTDQDKKWAVLTIEEAYAEQLKDEAEYNKRRYGVEKKSKGVFTGTVRYEGDVVTDEEIELTENSLENYNKINAILGTVDSNKPIQLKSDALFNVLSRGSASARITATAEFYETFTKVWNSSKVKQEITKANPGVDFHRFLSDRMRKEFGLRMPSSGRSAFIDKIIEAMTFNSLVGKPKIGINQTTSMLFWLPEQSTLDGFGARPAEYEGVNLAQFLYDSDPDLADRYRKYGITKLHSAMDEDTTGLVKLMKEKAGSKIADIYNMLLNFWMKTGDYIGIIWLGKRFFLGEYKKNRKNGMDHEAAEKAALYAFSKQYQRTQQSNDSLDKSNMQNSDWRVFNIFQTGPRQNRRNSASAIRQIVRQIRTGEGKGSLGYNIARHVLMYHVSAIAYNYIAMGMPGLLRDWEEDDTERLIAAGIIGPMSATFILGDVFQWLMTKHFGDNYDVVIGDAPIFAFLRKAQKSANILFKYREMDYNTMTDAQKKSFTRAQLNFLVDFIQVRYKVPLKTWGIYSDYEGELIITKFFDRIQNMFNGDLGDFQEGMMELIGLSDYVITESHKDPEPPKKKKKKKTSTSKFGPKKKKFGTNKSKFGPKKKKFS